MNIPIIIIIIIFTMIRNIKKIQVENESKSIPRQVKQEKAPSGQKIEALKTKKPPEVKDSRFGDHKMEVRQMEERKMNKGAFSQAPLLKRRPEDMVIEDFEVVPIIEDFKEDFRVDFDEYANKEKSDVSHKEAGRWDSKAVYKRKKEKVYKTKTDQDLGTTYTRDLRRAIVMAEVLDKPVSMRDR